VERVGVRELRRHANRYLDLVTSEQTVDVTERGQVVALLVPPLPSGDARARLMADGPLLPSAGPLPTATASAAVETSAPVVDGLRHDR